MASLYSYLAISSDPLPRAIRAVNRFVRNFTLPAPHWFFRPILSVYISLRELYYLFVRVLICEPLFKAYCEEYGRNVHTGVFIHWIMGRGRLILGDNVTVDGKCSFAFAVRYTDQPTLRIGNYVGIGDQCSFAVGREITIGNNVMMGTNIDVFDTPGHPTDPALRLAGSLRLTGAPALQEDVRAVHIEDNVWVGSGVTIFPGVTLGEGCVVARGSIVMSSVPPYVVVAGSPARQIARLTNPKEKS